MARARWGILVVPALLYFLSYFHRVAPVVVAGDLMAAFAVTAATLGALSAIYPYCFAAMALPGGSLADFLGPRRTLALGGLSMSAGSVLFGLAPGFGAAFAGRLLVGLGASVILIAGLRLAAEWFRTEEFATVAGAAQSVGSIGAVAGTTPLALLVEQIGWRQGFVVIGAATALVAIACMLTVRDRPEPSAARPRAAEPGLREIIAGIPGVLSNRHSWTVCLISGGIYGGFAAFVGLWGVPYLTQVYELPRVRAANLVGLAALGLLVGAPLLGWLSDRLKRRRLPLIIVSGLNALTWLALVGPATPIAAGFLPLVCFLIGLGSSVVVLVFAAVREVNDPRYVGVALGFHNLPTFLSFGLMQWVTGLVLDRHWDGALVAGARVYGADAYRAAFALCLLLAAGAFVSACLAPETRGRNIWSAA
ncbi:MAG TPA: MFS transporter [Candidatus Limnocylindria bacterium]|nr:MFS transporter [Candidatus Limnocylindria bacterium]